MAQIESEVISSIIRMRQEDGKFIPIFPINTINEVYYNIDKNKKLSMHLRTLIKSVEVESIDDLYKLTTGDVKTFDIIKVSQGDRYFIVKDTKNLNSELGYMEFLTDLLLGQPNGLPQLDSEGKIPEENINNSIEFITYTSSDINWCYIF